jgi:hypothetical protein
MSALRIKPIGQGVASIGTLALAIVDKRLCAVLYCWGMLQRAGVFARAFLACVSYGTPQ